MSDTDEESPPLGASDLYISALSGEPTNIFLSGRRSPASTRTVPQLDNSYAIMNRDSTDPQIILAGIRIELGRIRGGLDKIESDVRSLYNGS